MTKLILYVDDDIDDLEILQESFAGNLEYELIGIQDGNLLLNVLESKGNVCLVVIDINMPSINGIELLKRIKQHPVYAKLSVVMLSTTKLHIENELVRSLGVDIVVKPSSYQELKTLAGRLLEYC